ncbi:MAG TPA: hypothetical protein VGO62_18840 [Myxococcota bacterium]|jgi:hypothetical protein
MKDIADTIQARDIIPHCAVCQRPCCKLDDVVLALEWPQARDLYQIKTRKKEFDANLPPYIKEDRDMYYVHKRPCPAYVDKKCSVYGSKTKPQSCTDFPIYAEVDDDDETDFLTVDTRCEAVNLKTIEAEVVARYPKHQVLVHPDDEFPEIVTIKLASTPAAPRSRPSRR